MIRCRGGCKDPAARLRAPFAFLLPRGNCKICDMRASRLAHSQFQKKEKFSWNGHLLLCEITKTKMTIGNHFPDILLPLFFLLLR
jgi:hypothetical protein